MISCVENNDEKQNRREWVELRNLMAVCYPQERHRQQLKELARLRPEWRRGR
jgi:hypothetical protein